MNGQSDKGLSTPTASHLLISTLWTCPLLSLSSINSVHLSHFFWHLVSTHCASSTSSLPLTYPFHSYSSIKGIILTLASSLCSSMPYGFCLLVLYVSFLVYLSICSLYWSTLHGFCLLLLNVWLFGRFLLVTVICSMFS